MKLLSSLVLILLTFISFGQVNQVDAQGRKQGKWEKVYPGTRVYQYRGEFKNDKPIGKFTYFYKSSKVKAIIDHDEDSDRSVGYYYHETGGVMSFGIYRDLKKDSIWTNLNNKGQITSKETYFLDSLHGPRVVFYPPPEGVKKQMPSIVENYKNGMLDGDYIEYFENGTTKVKGGFKDNKRHGVWVHYHANGNKMMFNRYKNGRLHGWCMGYDTSGKEIAKKYYYYGRLLEGKDLEMKMKQMKELGINPNE